MSKDESILAELTARSQRIAELERDLERWKDLHAEHVQERDDKIAKLTGENSYLKNQVDEARHEAEVARADEQERCAAHLKTLARSYEQAGAPDEIASVLRHAAEDIRTLLGDKP